MKKILAIFIIHCLAFNCFLPTWANETGTEISETTKPSPPPLTEAEKGELSDKSKIGNESINFHNRKYSQMSKEEAKRLIEYAIKNRKVPSPCYYGELSDLPLDNVDAQGVKINNNDWIIFVAAIAECYPVDYFPLGATQEKMYPEAKSGFWEKFLVQGILVSTVDLMFITHQLYLNLSPAKDNILKRGGYIWSMANPGVIWLKGKTTTRFLFLEEPQKELGESLKKIIPNRTDGGVRS